MTDTELQRRKAICEVAGVDDIGNLSDGFHTFNGLYEQRMILFAALVNAYKDKSWKSYRHEDGEYCFGGGWFIVGIDTPEGSYTYHYENRYWNMFDCVDLPRAKHWDGHTEADAETRLMSLEPEIKTDGDTISRQAAIDALHAHLMYRMGTESNKKRLDEWINSLPSAQPEPCGDVPDNNVGECEDAVSREALRKAMYHRAFETDGDTMWQSGCWIRYRAVEQVIKESPPVTPKQERGKWEEKAVSDEKVIDEWQSARCSACGEYHTAPYMYYFNNYNYCPNCGARMTKEDV